MRLPSCDQRGLPRFRPAAPRVSRVAPGAIALGDPDLLLPAGARGCEGHLRSVWRELGIGVGEGGRRWVQTRWRTWCRQVETPDVEIAQVAYHHEPASRRRYGWFVDLRARPIKSRRLFSGEWDPPEIRERWLADRHGCDQGAAVRHPAQTRERAVEIGQASSLTLGRQIRTERLKPDIAARCASDVAADVRDGVAARRDHGSSVTDRRQWGGDDRPPLARLHPDNEEQSVLALVGGQVRHDQPTAVRASMWVPD